MIHDKLQDIDKRDLIENNTIINIAKIVIFEKYLRK